MSDPAPPRPYRPVALWFMGVVVVVVALGVLGEHLKRRATSSPDAPPPPAPSPGPPVDAVKAMRFVFRGTVRDRDGKTPVPGAQVEVVPRRSRREVLVADGAGAFSWTTVDATPAAMVWALVPGKGLGHVFVQGAPGREMAQDVVLVAPLQATFEVKSADGEVATGASVEAAVSGEDAPASPDLVARGTTDPRGLCRLEVPPRLTLRVRVRSADGTAEGEAETTAHDALKGVLATIVLRPKPADRR